MGKSCYIAVPPDLKLHVKRSGRADETEFSRYVGFGVAMTGLRAEDRVGGLPRSGLGFRRLGLGFPTSFFRSTKKSWRNRNSAISRQQR